MNYIFLADGYETVEALAVVDMMKRAKLPLTMVSMNDSLTVTTSHQVEMKADRLFSECDLTDADMLILPGGMPGTVNLEENEELMKKVKAHGEAGKNVAAICAAPRILGKLGLLSGKKATCYPGNEGDLKGADYTGGKVESDGNCITSRGMGTAVLFGAAIIEKLSDSKKAEEILGQIQY